MPLDGPRTILNEAMIEQIATNLASGCFLDQAATAAGIGRRTLLNWRRRGEEAMEKEAMGETLTANEVLYAEFCRRTEQARSAAAVHAHAVIRGAFDSDWRSAAWYLERTDKSNRYGRKVVRTGDLSELPAGEGDRETAIAEIESYLANVAEAAVDNAVDEALADPAQSNGHASKNGSNGSEKA